MEFVALLLLIVCFIPLAFIMGLFVTVVWMKNSEYGGVAIVITVFCIILVPIGLGIGFLGYTTHDQADDSIEDDSFLIQNNTVHSVKKYLRRGDTIEISFMSTTPLDVTIRRKVIETCDYEDVYDKSETIISNSESDSVVYSVKETTTYSVAFRGSGDGSGSAEITVTFDRSSSRNMGILACVFGGLLVGGSCAGFFWVHQKGKTERPVIPRTHHYYPSGSHPQTIHQQSPEFQPGTMQVRLAKTRYERYRERQNK
jgi:hypothetical protein